MTNMYESWNKPLVLYIDSNGYEYPRYFDSFKEAHDFWRAFKDMTAKGDKLWVFGSIEYDDERAMVDW